MNTTSDSPTKPTSAKSFEDLAGQSEPEPEPKKDEALVKMEEQLQSERNSRMEERFIWIVVCVVLVDVLWFRNASNGTFPIVILILELIALVILARRMKVEEIAALVDRLLYSIGQRGGGA